MNAVGCYFLTTLELSLWMRNKDGSRFLLKDKEREAFAKIYGIWDERQWQHQEVAEHLCLSRERIRQLELKAFRKLSFRKRQPHTPAGRLYVLLTGGANLSITGIPHIARQLHDFHATHLPEWDRTRFFRFAELFLDIKGLAKASKRISPKTLSKPTAKDSLEHLTDKIIWPTKTETFPHSFLQTFSPQRGIRNKQEEDAFTHGEFYSKKLQRNVFYESGLEKKFFALLERSGQVHTYCEQPFTLTVNIGGQPCPYTPDVLVQLEDGRCVAVEIKPLTHMAITEVLYKFQQLYTHCCKQGWGVLLSDGHKDLSYLYHYPPNPAFEQALLHKLAEKRRLTIGDIRLLRSTFNGTSLQLVRCILHHNLSYREYPTLLWRVEGGGVCEALKKRLFGED